MRTTRVKGAIHFLYFVFFALMILDNPGLKLVFFSLLCSSEYSTASPASRWTLFSSMKISASRVYRTEISSSTSRIIEEEHILEMKLTYRPLT